MEENINNEFDLNNENLDTSSNQKDNKYKMLIAILIILLIGALCGIYFLTKDNNKKSNDTPTETKENNDYLVYALKGNSISDFDLYFLKLENNGKNKVYSPLSIKYALEMLKEGANGNTKKQIADIVGDYTPKSYPNNEHMSFANALFVKDSYKNSVKNNYIDVLKQKYNAEIVYDSFTTPDKINSWISNKTFKLINGLVNDASKYDFILTNALAIDMEWVNKIQPEEWDWGTGYIHEDYSKYVGGLGNEEGYHSLKFNNVLNTASVEVGALINKYDIVNVMGEDNVRKIVGDAYQKWLDEGAENSCYDPEYSDESEKDPDKETFLNEYIKEINTNYKQLDSSTDFSFYIDDSIKVFSKDLKKYEGTTLKYIAIMPTKTLLTEYIKGINADEINSLINKLKPFALETFKDGVITDLTAYIPMFKYNSELDLKNDLNKLGITDVFTDKADLSNLTNEKAKIDDALHKSTIEFSNSGIKAAAVSLMAGAGAGECGFDYIFEIPKNRIEKIDLTFNKPYIYLILDKNTKEVWFTGSVYEPSEYDSYIKNIEYSDDWDE